MKRSYLIYVLLILVINFVSALSVSTNFYNCGVGGNSCVLVKQNVCAASCTLTGITLNSYCNLSTSNFTFKYDSFATGTLGSDLTTSKATAFVCGVCYKDADNDGYFNSSYLIVNGACSAGYTLKTVSPPLDCNDNNVNIWRNISNLGVDSDADGFVLENSVCQERCVGMNNSYNVYSNGSANFSNCGVVDCDDGYFDLSNNHNCIAKNLKWRDLNGEVISVAQVSDTVALSFDQIDVDPSIGDTNYSVLNGSTVIYSANSNKNFTFWKIVPGVFKYSIVFKGKTYYSQNLTVSGLENDSGPNLVNISFPLDWAKYNVGYVIQFNQTSKDSDDLLTLVWGYGDETNVSVNNYSYFEKNLSLKNFGNVEKSYSSPGVYDVKLTANEKGRSLSSSNSIRVVVVQEGVNVIPIISSPEKGKSLGSDVVAFDASQTYVVNCSICASGCSGNRDNGYYTQDGRLNCTYLHAPGTFVGQNLPSNYNLIFKWDLGDGRIVENRWNSSTYYGLVRFVYRYVDAGEHVASLEVNYL